MAKLLGTGNIRDKYEVVIPKEVRQHLKIKPGDKILLILEHGQVVIKRGDIDIEIK